MARTNLSKRQIRFPINTKNRDALSAVLNDVQGAADAIIGDGTTQTEVVTSGALSATKLHSNLSVTGTVAFTLAAPTKAGQRKTLRTTTAASTPVATCTGVFNNAGSAATTISALGATTAFVELRGMADLTGWDVVYSVGATFA